MRFISVRSAQYLSLLLCIFIILTFFCSARVDAAEVLIAAGGDSFALWFASLLSALGVSVVTSVDGYRDFCDAIQPSLPPGLQGVYNNFLVSGAYAMTGVLLASAYDWLATDDVQSHVISAPGGAYLTSYGMCIDGVNVVVDASLNFTLDDCRYFFVGSGGAIDSIGLNVWHDFTFFPSLSHSLSLSLIHQNSDNYDGVFYLSDHTTFVSQLRYPTYLHFELDYDNYGASRLRIMSSYGYPSSYNWVVGSTQSDLSASTAADLRAVYNSFVAAGSDSVSISMPAAPVVLVADEVVAVTVPGAASATSPADVAQLVDDFVGGTDISDSVVSSAAAVSLSITRFPTRLIYQAGDFVDLTGLEVVTVMNTGESLSVDIDDVIVSIPFDCIITSSTTDIVITVDDLTASIPISVPVTAAGGILEYLQSVLGGLWDIIVGAVSSALEWAFKPTFDWSSCVNPFDGVFSWLRQIYEYISGFISSLDDGTPIVIYADFGASTGHFSDVGSLKALDTSFYSPYKPTSDVIISSFLWLVFAWSIWRNSISIISGVKD